MNAWIPGGVSRLDSHPLHNQHLTIFRILMPVDVQRGLSDQFQVNFKPLIEFNLEASGQVGFRTRVNGL